MPPVLEFLWRAPSAPVTATSCFQALGGVRPSQRRTSGDMAIACMDNALRYPEMPSRNESLYDTTRYFASMLMTWESLHLAGPRAYPVCCIAGTATSHTSVIRYLHSMVLVKLIRTALRSSPRRCCPCHFNDSTRRHSTDAEHRSEIGHFRSR